MASQVILRPLSPQATTPEVIGWNPVILKGSTKPSAQFAEVAGGTAADCAVICCCFPCGLVNLLILAVVKLPVGLCRRALRRRRKMNRTGSSSSSKKVALLGHKVGTITTYEDEEAGLQPSEEVSELEKEMWARFYSAGFWRSSSQREHW